MCFRSQKGSLYNGLGSKIPSHGIDRNLHDTRSPVLSIHFSSSTLMISLPL
jgi:hypothetical protein